MFRSQATQGDPWTGTASIVDEHLSVVVHRDYLDVELEWQVRGAAGSVLLVVKAGGEMVSRAVAVR